MTLSRYSAPLLATLGMATGFPALAGGLTEPVYEPAPVVAPVVAPSDWTGFYTGIFLGYADDDADVDDWGDIGFDDQPNPSGALGGIAAGYNFQSGKWVYGIEADIAATDLNDTGSLGRPDGLPDDVPDTEFKIDINSMATLRGRVGYDMGRWMPYATAGVAAADADYTLYTPTGSVKDDNGMTGYTVGFGAEYAINDRWSAKGEYLYTSLEGRFEGDGFNTDVDHEIHAVRAGLNYRF